MSTQVGTSRAGRTSKDKHAKSTVATTPAAQIPAQKTEKSAPKHQATVEQMRMAQMIDSGKDANADTVKVICEMTGCSEEDVIVALHDAQDNADQAVTILLEGGQGEWEVQDKKKKRSNTLKSEKETATVQTQDSDRTDSRPDRSRDRFDFDRHDVPPRRGRDRRNGGPPPRLANRGRGRERNNYRGDRDRSGFNDRGGFGERSNYNNNDRSTFNGEEDWDAEINEFREQRRNDRDRGFGGDRGRGRGRGGGFGRPNSRGGRPRRFERQNESSDGPHIDTWTNETAENAEKENASWAESADDMCEDQWTGSLDESKVFTPSQIKPIGDSDMRTTLNDSSNSVGQRVDMVSLFSKSAEFAKAPDFTKTSETTSSDPFFSSYNQQAAESIKNSIGIGSSSARQNLSNISASQPQSLGQLPAMPQYVSSQSPRSTVSSMLPSSTSSVPPSMLPPATSAPLSNQPPVQQQTQPQRRPQRSKLPPPSKIPASAVEMPGHLMPQLDVQFGVDFGADSAQFGFGSTGDTNTSYSSSSPPSNQSLSNHLGQSSKSQAESSRQANIMSSPSAGSKATQNSLPSMDASPSRPSVFPGSVYTTPTKSDSSANKVAEPIPYPSPGPDHKSGSLMNSQRTTQSPSALSQGSLSTSKPDTSSMPNFSAANGYASSTYPSHSSHSQSHKSVSSASQTYPHTAPVSQTSSTSYPNQYSSQTQYSGNQQNQYPAAGQSQFPGAQNQFPAAGSAGSSAQAPPPSQFLSGQSQYQSGSQGSFPSAPVVSQSQYQSGGSQYHSNYQSSSTSFQSQPGSQSAQNSLYPNTTQQSGGSYSSGSNQQTSGSYSSGSNQQSGGSYPSGSSSFHVRDSQSGGNLQQSSVSQSSNTYQTQPPAPGLSKASTTQSPSAYSTQTFSAQHASQHASQHAPNLQASPLGNKLGDSLSKMSLKDSTSLDSRSSQYDHGSSSTTTVSLTSTTTNSTSISTSTSTVSATSTPVVTSSTLNARVSTSLPVTTKTPPNLPPGVPLVNPHLFVGTAAAAAASLPPYFPGLQGLQSLQQPIYGYEDLQLMQQAARLPMQTGNYYDLTAYSGIPSTIAAGRDQAAALGTVPFTGTATDNKQMNRVEAQSPSQSNQQQSTHSAPQQTLPFNIPYGYYYPGAVLPGAASFQYPTMFPMPPVTNAAAHVPGTTTAAQLPKTYSSHQGFPSKGGYEEVSGGQDLTKVAYAGVQQQAKVAAAAAVASRTGSTAEINTGVYTKSHTQGFDKQGFPGGTPPPFNLPLANASQAGGPLGAPGAPYGAPFLPMIPPQPHNQTILHHPLQQDSGTGSGRGLQQPANQGKTGAAKPYGANWGAY